MNRAQHMRGKRTVLGHHVCYCGEGLCIEQKGVILRH